jgi:hypothetical protein
MILDKPVRVVVCAANKYGEHIVLGARHHDNLMNLQINLSNIDTDDGGIQGFIDQRGIFMDRVEALAVATAANQINTRRPKNPGEWLCSEDLY